MSEIEFNKRICLLNNIDDVRESKRYDIIGIEAKNANLISEFDIELAFNVASMQEMNPSVIKEYFYYLRNTVGDNEIFFYCCNVEMKILPDGTVVKFSEYPWSKEDVIYDDKICPWHQYHFNYKPLFKKYYDGVIKHRLVQLKKDKKCLKTQ